MHLIVGLGNPGAEHAGQRHNVGFMALDRIAQRWSIGPFRSKFRAEIADGAIDGRRVLLAKPQTYMNRSGDAVAEIVRFYKLAPDAITVLYDELDLAPGKLKAKQGGGTAGHNGLRSIDPQIGQDYWRVRIGIGHPGDKSLVHRWVLSDFAKADADWLEPLLDGIAAEMPALLDRDTGRFIDCATAALRPPPRPKPAPQNDRGPAPEAPKRQAAPEGGPFAKLKDLFKR